MEPCLSDHEQRDLDRTLAEHRREVHALRRFRAHALVDHAERTTPTEVWLRLGECLRGGAHAICIRHAVIVEQLGEL
jgi:hypothetical protein